MKKIGLLSDTHSHLDDRIIKHLSNCDEIWHAGDIGDLRVTDELAKIAPIRAVYGNIDNAEIRITHPRDQIFELNGLKIWITHIGGRPPRFAPGILTELNLKRPDLFICGHSHILLAQGNQTWGGLHLNPGAAGKYGNHKVRTLMRFNLSRSGVQNLEVVELNSKS